MSDFPANDADDTELKKRARRRLVGASALALLAVIVLPLVLNREVPRTVPDMQVSIPNVPPTVADVDSSRVDIEPDAVAPVTPARTDPPEPPTVQRTPPPVQPPPVQSPPVQSPPRAPVQGTAPVQPASPANPPGHARDTEAARVIALLGGTESASGRATRDRVFVQVGAFSDSIRAVAQAEELKRQGFAAYAEKRGNMTRVRIGPLPKEDAKKVVARLNAKGRKAVVSSH